MQETGSPTASENRPTSGQSAQQPFRERFGAWILNEQLAWIVLLFAFAVTFVAWQGAEETLFQAQQSRFENRTTEVTNVILERMRGYEQVLRGGVGMLAASKNVTRTEWKDYVASLRVQEHYPGIQGIGFSIFVPAERLTAHQRTVRAQGFPDYEIRPPGTRAEYTSIIYLEPFDWRNQRAFGFDMFSEPIRRAAMERARDSGEAAISSKVTLLQEADKDVQSGILMYLPCYKNGVPLNTLAERRANLLGYVYSPFRLNDLMRGILGKRPGAEMDIDIEVYDGTAYSTDSLLYDDDKIAHALDTGAHEHLALTKTIDLYGHTWSLYFVTRPPFYAAFDKNKPLLILLAGTVLGLMLAGLIRMFATQRRRALELASKMSAEATSTAEKLRAAMSIQKAIFNSTNYAIFSTDVSGLIKTFNSAAEKMLGYHSDELIGKSTPGIFHDRQEIERYAVKLSDEIGQAIAPGFEVFAAKPRLGTTDENEWTYIRKDGTRVPVYLSVSALLDEAGLVAGFVGVAMDISARKAAEQALRDGESRLAAILDNVLDAIITINEDGVIETCNKASERIFGYSTGEMVGRSVKMLMPKLYHRQHENQRHSYFSTGRKQIIGIGRQVVGLRKDGSAFPVELAVSEMWMGEKRMFTGVVRDITERVKIERMKSEFISTVSHELRTPLTSIRGALGLIAGGVAGDLPAQARSLVDIAHKNSERLILLVNDILDMEKIESGKMSFNLKPLELTPLIEHAVEANQAYAGQFNVSYVFEHPQTAPVINIDADRFMQVLANLLSNAAKFSPPGGSVDISVQTLDHNVRVSVADHGHGIPEAFKSKIFQKFSQADASDTRAKSGTGLGLSITKAIVEMMGGRIGFDSGGEGTTFHVEFPEWAPRPKPELQGTTTGRDRILICENDREVARRLQAMLDQGGYDSDVAYSIGEAKGLLSSRQYRAITLDIMLPDQSGIFLLRELHVSAATRDIPVIVVSASVGPYSKDLESGMVVLDWITKPIDETRLLSALHRVTGKGGAKPVILHVEDDDDICQVLLALVGNEGRVVVAPTLADAKKRIASEHIDLIILDLALPDGPGLDLLPFLSERGYDIPVMVFSATELNDDVVQLVKAALVKSRTTNEQLLAKIKQLINRA